MKKTKLVILSLLAISAIGLTSCGSQGPKGDKGDQGIQGKQGEPGKDGKNGVNGKDGKDGLPGKDGKDGKVGVNGSNGADGKIAYSNTIFPSVGGYVVPSVGSALVGDEVTFTIHIYEGYILNTLMVDGQPAVIVNNSYTTTMKENGFVVSATFINVNKIVDDNNDALAQASSDGTLNSITNDVIESKVDFDVKDSEQYEVNAFKSYVYLLEKKTDLRKLNTKLLTTSNENELTFLAFDKDGKLVRLEDDGEKIVDKDNKEYETDKHTIILEEDAFEYIPYNFSGSVIVTNLKN